MGVDSADMLQTKPTEAAPSRVAQASYYGAHAAAFAIFGLAQRATRRLLKQDTQSDVVLQRELRTRYLDLLAQDLRNVTDGIYPAQALRELPVDHYARQLPNLLTELPRLHRRRERVGYSELPVSAKLESYPPYYRRNFHWQSDGYLSRESAKLYDLSVEFLFLGAADVMRRQVALPMRQWADRRNASTPLRILDVGCGTGRTLQQLLFAFPEAELIGVDLSEPYVAFARQSFTDHTNATFVCDNGESLPFPNHDFDIVTSTYLFHELPKFTRRRVIAEMRRVLKPGGLAVVQDSVQRNDSATLMPVLDAFHRDFHEPFYRHYLEDDLEELFAESGIRVEESKVNFVAKTVSGTLPSVHH